MVLDATIAGSSANSYLTVVAADESASDDLGRFAEKWLDAVLDRKERCLIRASREISSRLGPTVRYSATQLLAWPRSIDYTGVAPATTPLLHPELLRATYEQAIFLNAVAETLDDSAQRRAQGTFSASDDNGSFSLAADPQLGRISPEALAAIESLRGQTRRSSRVIVSIPMRSATYPEDGVL